MSSAIRSWRSIIVRNRLFTTDWKIVIIELIRREVFFMDCTRVKNNN